MRRTRDRLRGLIRSGDPMDGVEKKPPGDSPEQPDEHGFKQLEPSAPDRTDRADPYSHIPPIRLGEFEIDSGGSPESAEEPDTGRTDSTDAPKPAAAPRQPRVGISERFARLKGSRGSGGSTALGSGSSGSGNSERLNAARERLTGLAGAAGSGIGAAGAGIGSAGRRVGDVYRGVPLLVRQRVVAAAVVVATAAIVWLVILPAAPCWAPAGDQCPPPDDAIEIVPADALAYAHLDVDSSTDQSQAAGSITERLPLLSATAVSTVSGLAGPPIDYATDVAPWAGGEAALAVLGGGLRLDRVLLIEIADEAGAEEFAADFVGADAATSEVDGVEVSTGKGGISSATVDKFLVLGAEEPVGDVIATSRGDESLATAADEDVLEELPDQRLAYAYLSPDGAETLLRGGQGRQIDTFVDAEATEGAAASLSIEGDLLELAVRSELDPDRADASPDFFAALPPFEPTLADSAGPDSLAYLGLGDPAGSVAKLLSQAAIGAPGLLAGFERFEKDLGKQGGVSIERDLLPLLGSQVAIAVEPTVGPGGGEGGAAGGSGTPYVSLIADDVNSRQAGRVLAELQGAVAETIEPASRGQVPTFETTTIDGVEAQSLQISPAVNLTYAIDEDRLIVTTNPDGIVQARSGGDGLPGSERFERVTDGLPEEVSLLSYLDLRGLISIGEQIGLATDPGYAAIAGDLRALEAAAISVEGGGNAIRTDLRVLVGDRIEADLGASPVEGG